MSLRRLALPLLCLVASPLVARVASAAPCPNIMLVLDQSASMAQDPNGNEPTNMDGSPNPMFQAPSKFQILQDTIVNLVRMYGDRVPFGLELFNSNAYMNDAQCYSDTKITVEVSHTSTGAIITAVQAATPANGTNTGEAIDRAAADTSLNDIGANGQKKRLILLVTDGQPTCNSGDKDGSTPSFSDSQIGMAKTMGIDTYVIGFTGGDSGQDTTELDNFAYFGGTQVATPCGADLMPPVSCFYQAGATEDDFNTVLTNIITTVGAGEFNSMLCDDTCYSMGCPKGQICTTDEANPVAHCVNNPCDGKQCSGGQFCREGACVGACTGGCKATEKCQDGTCVADPCAGVTCSGAGQVCNPADGKCIESPCADCRIGATVCDVVAGSCVPDQCAIVTCPKGLTCSFNGNCSKPAGSSGGGGCATAPVERGSAAAGGMVLAAFALLFVILFSRRRVTKS